MAQFPILYAQSVTDKTKMWSIRVIEQDGCGVIETVFGYEDGKKQTQQKVISVGKNIGKKNETTPLQQAISEARALWIKKKEKDYAPIESNNEEEEEEKDKAGKGKGVDMEVPSPMLAHDYNKRGKSIRFPCYVQPKLDGTRSVAIPGKGLFSRNRKSYPHLEHIVEEINKLPPSILLDGELYSDTLTFQEIVGLVKKETLTADEEKKQLQIKYHVYDMIDSGTFQERFTNLQLLFRRNRFNHLVFVTTEKCENEQMMKEKHGEYVQKGYEGIMLRNADGVYSNNRSAHLQKYKEFMDDEYNVIGYEQGQGLEEGCVIWVCETSDGKPFNCRPRGAREERQEMYLHGDDYVGKKLTVRYQELTDDGKPRFPVGIAFRDYE